MHAFSHLHISLVDASPVKHQLLLHEIEDMVRELAFTRPLELKAVLENTLKLPDNALKLIFNTLNYDQVCVLAGLLKDSIPNPIDQTRLNPLKYHDATSDDQAALKKWYIESGKSDLSSLQKFGFYLLQLLDNPTVIINPDDALLMKRIVKVASIQRDPLIYKELFTKLKARFENINLNDGAWKFGSLDLISFLLDKGWIIKNAFAVYRAQMGGNQSVLEFLANEGVVGFQVQRSRYDQLSDVHLSRHLLEADDEYSQDDLVGS